jgi:hypothetical protein
MESVRGLAGAGPSQVGPGGAMRARDVSRPRPEHLAAAAEPAEPSARSKRRQTPRRRERNQGDDGTGS